MEILAFLANYCQTVGLLDHLDKQSTNEHPYVFGFRFAQEFLGGPRSPLRSTFGDVELRMIRCPGSAKTKPGELLLRYHTRHLGLHGEVSEPLRGKRKKYGQWSQSIMKMLIVWFVVLIVFSLLCGKLSEVPDSSKVSITSHMWVRLGTSWIGAHVPTGGLRVP
jgi:hypothetical protein